jgi:hypothetical protein
MALLSPLPPYPLPTAAIAPPTEEPQLPLIGELSSHHAPFFPFTIALRNERYHIGVHVLYFPQSMCAPCSFSPFFGFRCVPFFLFM